MKMVFALILKLAGQMVLAMELQAAIAMAAPRLKISSEAQQPTRFEYAFHMVQAAEENDIDPFLVAAVMWHESDFRNVTVKRTKDYGLMQLHWQNARWLKGLTKKDLMKPSVNIHAGARAMAYFRRLCARRHNGQHNWWGHYKYGNVVRSRRYDRKINWRYQKLLRSRTKHRGEGKARTQH